MPSESTVHATLPVKSAPAKPPAKKPAVAVVPAASVRAAAKSDRKDSLGASSDAARLRIQRLREQARENAEKNVAPPGGRLRRTSSLSSPVDVEQAIRILKEPTAEQVFAYFDKSQDSRLDVHEFRCAFVRPTCMPPQRGAKQPTRLYAARGGSCRHMCKVMDPRMSPDEIARLMQQADINHDKLIDLTEFKLLWNDRHSFAQARTSGSHFNTFFSSVVGTMEPKVEAPPTFVAQEETLLDLFIGAPPQPQPATASDTPSTGNLIDI